MCFFHIPEQIKASEEEVECAIPAKVVDNRKTGQQKNAGSILPQGKLHSKTPFFGSLNVLKLEFVLL